MKAVWAFLYCVLAALTALTIYLYVIPERDMMMDETAAPASEPEWVEIPVIALNGAEVTAGYSVVGELTDTGLTLEYEVDGKRYALDPADAEKNAAKPASQYVVYVCAGGKTVAELRYTNITGADLAPEECEIDFLDFRTSMDGFGTVPVFLDGVDMTTFSMDQAEEKFPDFTRTSSRAPEYRKSIVAPQESMAAYFRADEETPDRLAAFGVRNYLPGSGRQDGKTESGADGERFGR